MKKKWTISSLDELQGFAGELTTSLKVTESQSDSKAVVVTLSGNLGAGKTTLTQMIATELGVTEAVSSPTFVITKYYDLKKQKWKRLIHMDTYRLEGFSTEPLGLSDLFANPDNLIIIEWPNIIEKDLPQNRINISIEQTGDSKRKILIT